VTAPATSGAPFVHLHRVRFEEVDAAGIAYFARFFTWCHDAMEAMLAPLERGYAELVNERRLGMPAVHVDADFASPLRFGDEVRIATVVERIGRSSASLRFRLERDGGDADGRHVATIRHVVALTDLDAMRSRPWPTPLRTLLERHVVAGEPSPSPG
jgi:4-hydroxybenzoyl-CoA thioesterase